jgi:FMN phosphatase YigB (HAD superfamily)
MIRILMLDLGDTLVHGDQALPGSRDALRALQEFETKNDAPLEICLVSDFHLASPADNTSDIERLFGDYLLLLERLGLRGFFEPVAARVTLSTHVGAFKPDRRVFETAIARLGLKANWQEVLFITENEDHIAACQELGMKTLHFNADSSVDADFHHWDEAAQLVSQLIWPS